MRPTQQSLHAQTFDEIDASVATPDKRSIQVVRNPSETVAYPSPRPGISFSLVQAPVPTALLYTLIAVCDAVDSVSNVRGIIMNKLTEICER